MGGRRFKARVGVCRLASSLCAFLKVLVHLFDELLDVRFGRPAPEVGDYPMRRLGIVYCAHVLQKRPRPSEAVAEKSPRPISPGGLQAHTLRARQVERVSNGILNLLVRQGLIGLSDSHQSLATPWLDATARSPSIRLLAPRDPATRSGGAKTIGRQVPARIFVVRPP